MNPQSPIHDLFSRDAAAGRTTVISLFGNVSKTVHSCTHKARKSSKPQEDTWNRHVEMLKEFKASHGHCNPPKSGSELSRWVYAVRSLKNRGILSSERTRQLTHLGFMWDPRLEKWEDKFSDFKSFMDTRRHADTTSKYTLAELKSFSKSLYEWSNGINNALLDDRFKDTVIWKERRQRLEVAGFVFSESVLAGARPKRITATWEDRIDELKKVPLNNDGRRHVPPTPGLGLWLREQRESIKRGTLPFDKVNELHSLKVEFYPRKSVTESLKILASLSARMSKHHRNIMTAMVNVENLVGSMGVAAQTKEAKAILKPLMSMNPQ